MSEANAASARAPLDADGDETYDASVGVALEPQGAAEVGFELERSHGYELALTTPEDEQKTIFVAPDRRLQAGVLEFVFPRELVVESRIN